ncbi:hypothetical protein DESC_100084 [Desulfosarcina cetonica]|nr:hypothetical protein DESC_100084 [Desulfosarcina cetonica]
MSTASFHQRQVLGFGEEGDPQALGLFQLGGTDLFAAHQVVGVAAHRRLHLGAQGSGAGLHGLTGAVDHLAGEDDALAGNGAVGGSLLGSQGRAHQVEVKLEHVRHQRPEAHQILGDGFAGDRAEALDFRDRGIVQGENCLDGEMGQQLAAVPGAEIADAKGGQKSPVLHRPGAADGDGLGQVAGLHRPEAHGDEIRLGEPVNRLQGGVAIFHETLDGFDPEPIGIAQDAEPVTDALLDLRPAGRVGALEKIVLPGERAVAGRAGVRQMDLAARLEHRFQLGNDLTAANDFDTRARADALAADVAGVMGRDPANGGAGQGDRGHDHHRGDIARATHLPLHLLDRRFGRVALAFDGDLPAIVVGRGAHPGLQTFVGHFGHDPVGGIVHLGLKRFCKLAALLDQLLAGDDSRLDLAVGQETHHAGFQGFAGIFIERIRGDDADHHVARVLEELGHVGVEIGFDHHDFAHALPAAADGLHPLGKGTGNLIADFAVAAGGEHLAVVPPGQTVQLGGQPEGQIGDAQGIGLLLYPVHEPLQLLAVVGLFDGEHGGRVAHLLPAAERLRFHGLQERVVRGALAQLFHQAVVLGVRNDRGAPAVGLVVGREQIDEFIYGGCGHGESVGSFRVNKKGRN